MKQTSLIYILPICIAIISVQAVLLFNTDTNTSLIPEMTRNDINVVDPAHCFRIEKVDTSYAEYTFFSFGSDQKNDEQMPDYCSSYSLFTPERRVIAMAKEDNRLYQFLNKTYNNSYAAPNIHATIQSIDCLGHCTAMDALYTVTQEAGHYYPLEKVYTLDHTFGVPNDSFDRFYANVEVRTEFASEPGKVAVSFGNSMTKHTEFEIYPIYEPVCTKDAWTTITQLAFVGDGINTTSAPLSIDVDCVQIQKGPTFNEVENVYEPASPTISIPNYNVIELNYADETISILLDESPSELRMIDQL